LRLAMASPPFIITFPATLTGKVLVKMI